MEKEIVKHIAFLYKVAQRLTKKNHHQSEDLVQETLLKALDKKHLFKEGELKAWLYVILFNTFRTRWRNNRREVSLDENLEDVDNLSFKNNYYIPPSQLSYIELNDVFSLIKNMSSDKQDILALCFEGLSYEEISKVLNIPMGTVKSRISRIRDELRKKLE